MEAEEDQEDWMGEVEVDWKEGARKGGGGRTAHGI